MVTIDDFKKLDIRIGKVISAEKVESADKLLKLIFDMGNEERQIIAGIAEVFPEPEKLVGKLLPVIVNLEPRKLRGLESQGMLLAVEADGKPVLLSPSKKVKPGSLLR